MIQNIATYVQGSFVTAGVGFRYLYSAYNRELDIVLNGDNDDASNDVIMQLKFDCNMSDRPAQYVDMLEKTTQISSLMYSSNATINLAETVDEMRLTSLLRSNAHIARLAYDLQMGDFERFDTVFSHDFDLKNVRIRKFDARKKESAFYTAQLETQKDNLVSVRASSLSELMTLLAERVLRDLVALEVSYELNSPAKKLLNAATKMSMIARILDIHYIPARKLSTRGHEQNRLHSSFVKRQKTYTAVTRTGTLRACFQSFC